MLLYFFFIETNTVDVIAAAFIKPHFYCREASLLARPSQARPKFGPSNNSSVYLALATLHSRSLASYQRCLLQISAFLSEYLRLAPAGDLFNH